MYSEIFQITQYIFIKLKSGHTCFVSLSDPLQQGFFANLQVGFAHLFILLITGRGGQGGFDKYQMSNFQPESKSVSYMTKEWLKTYYDHVFEKCNKDPSPLSVTNVTLFFNEGFPNNWRFEQTID